MAEDSEENNYPKYTLEITLSEDDKQQIETVLPLVATAIEEGFHSGIEYPVNWTLKKIVHTCESCAGTGIVEGEHYDDKQACLTCNGKGQFN